MRIAIDISQIVYGTGVSVYTKSLVDNLLEIDKENKYILFGGALRRIGDLRRFGARVFPIPPTLADVVWNRLHTLPIETLIGKVDVFHSSDWTQPPSRAFKVTTIHDLSPVLFPKLIAKENFRNIYAVHMRRLSWVKKEVDRIIVPSNATKKDLLKMGFNDDKIRVIPEAIDPNFNRATESKINEVRARYQINSDYLIVVGANPRKNISNIITAYEQYKLKKDVKLVIIGTPQGVDLKEDRGLRILGHVSNDEKRALLSGAEALVYPSIYEGFGIPILEAFACECPVLTSNVSSLPEVAGNAAILVDPYDPYSIKSGIDKCLRNRIKLIELGKKRLKEFSWIKTAEQTLAVYKEKNT